VEERAALVVGALVLIQLLVLAVLELRAKVLRVGMVGIVLLSAVVVGAVLPVLAQTQREAMLAMVVQQLLVQLVEHRHIMLVEVVAGLALHQAQALLALAAVQQPQHKKAAHQTAQATMLQEMRLMQPQILEVALEVAVVVEAQIMEEMAVQA
jgi:hypothetical protein